MPHGHSKKAANIATKQTHENLFNGDVVVLFVNTKENCKFVHTQVVGYQHLGKIVY
jgi:hypothetical protein